MAEDGWTRLPLFAVAFIILKGSFRLVRENLAWVAGVGAGLSLFERFGPRELGLVGAAAAILGVVGAFAYYRNFRYRLDADVFRVRRGLFEVSETELHADRIQHIGVNQPIYMRVFGLASVSVDTPGAGGREVELPGIPRAAALSLSRRLAALRDAAKVTTATAAEMPIAAPEGDVRFRATPRGITLHGAANQSILVAAAALAPVAWETLPRVAEALSDYLGGIVRALAAHSGSWLAAGLALGLVVLAILVATSIGIAWIRYYGYELSRQSDRYAQRSGLLSRQEQTLTLPRLQAIDRVDTAVGRLLGRCYLVCRQIGEAGPTSESARSFTIPALARDDATRLLDEIWPGAADLGALSRPSAEYRRVLAVRYGLLSLPIVLLVAVIASDLRWLAAAPLALFAVWPIAYARWRALGYRIGDRFACARRGLLGRRMTIAPTENAQQVAVTQSPYQRRRGLATLTVMLADGPMTIPYVPEPRARHLADRALARVEAPAAARRSIAAAPPITPRSRH